MANEFKIKNGFLSNGDSEITGSLIVTEGISGSFSGSFQGDGSQLTGISGENIYTADGSLTGDRTVDLNAYDLNLEGAQVRWRYDANGYLEAFKVSDGVEEFSYTPISGGLAIFGRSTGKRAVIEHNEGGIKGYSNATNINYKFHPVYDNWLCGGTNDLGIGVPVGTNPSAKVHIKGNGATYGTTALLVENSSGVDALIVRDDSRTGLNGNPDNDFILNVTGEGTTNAKGSIQAVNSLGTTMFSVDNEGTGLFNKDLRIVNRSAINSTINSTWSLEVKGFTSNTAEGAFNFVNSSNDLIMKGVNNQDVIIGGGLAVGQTGLPSARLHIKGSGATAATTSLFVENNSATQLLKLDDNGGFAIGLGASYTVNNTVTIGYNALTSANFAISIGGFTDATAASAIAIGYLAQATNSQAIAIGRGANTTQSNSISLGYNTDATNTGTIAFGNQAQATGYEGITMGTIATASGGRSTALGGRSLANATRSMAIGNQANATANYSIMLNARNGVATNSTANSFAVNCNSTDHLFFIGNTADGWLNSTGGFVFGATTVDATAALQVDSTTKGFLPPRMTTTERNAITTPAAGLVIFNTTTSKHEGYDGTTWNAFY